MKKPKALLRMTLFVLGLSLLAASFFCVPADASLIELEPDMFRVGTDVSNLFEGVTLNRHISSGPFSASYAPVYVESDPSYPGLAAATGSHSFGYFYGIPSNCWTGGFCGFGFNALLIQFDSPTNYVDIAASWGLTSGSEPLVYAFDPNNQLVTSAGFSSGGYNYLRYNVSPNDFAATISVGSLDRVPFI